jgi:ABC-2 type transport system permease protein
MKNLIKKELNSYLNTPLGYIITILFGIFANFFFVKDLFITGSASLRPFFLLLPWFLLIFVPGQAMRSFSEEKRTNTIEVLLTLPYQETQIVLAKFLANLILFFIALSLTLSLPLSLSFLTKIYLPEVLVSYLGVLFLGASFSSLSLFFSSQTKNQVISFLSSVVCLFFLLLLGTDFFASLLPKNLQEFFVPLSPLYHFQNFVKGILDFRSLFYFFSFTFLFLFLTVLELEKRN